MEVEALGGVNLRDCVVWMIRIMLPIVLFWIWHNSQQADEPTGNVYSRKELLGGRSKVDVDDVPENLEGIQLMPDAQVQKAFGLPPTRPGPPQRGGAGGKGGGKRGQQQRRDRDDFGISMSGQSRGDGEKEKEAEAESLSEVEKSQFEALLNLVVTGFKDQPRKIFLPEEGNPPPAPRKSSRRGSSCHLKETSSEEATAANAEAQSVLKALVNPKFGLRSAEVPAVIHRQLEDGGFEPTEATYTLLVESCVQANDLRSASDFLMKMEAVGHIADQSLLDRVMDLYSRNRANNTGTCQPGGAAAAGATSPKTVGAGSHRPRQAPNSWAAVSAEDGQDNLGGEENS